MEVGNHMTHPARLYDGPNHSRGVVLVTGCSGFIGSELVGQLKSAGYRVIGATRDVDRIGNYGLESVRLPLQDDPVGAFQHILQGVDHVVHLAALHHTRHAVPAHMYHSVNCVLSAKLAKAAHQTISGKFVFVSTIRAQCGTIHEGVAVESDPPRPTDDYGRAKLAAEIEIAAGLPRGNYTILRPVLVYGAGVEANLATLTKLAALPVPLPLNSLPGKRSLLDRGALCRAIIHSLNEPKTDGGTFIVSDKNPVTLSQIVAAMRRGLDRSPWLFSFPSWILNPLANITGQGERRKRLNGDLVASSRKLQLTGWEPVLNTERQIEEFSGEVYRRTRTKPVRYASHSSSLIMLPAESFASILPGPSSCGRAVSDPVHHTEVDKKDDRDRPLEVPACTSHPTCDEVE